MFDILLFDLDGTLTRSEQGIVNSVLYALNEMGITEDNREGLKRFIGPPLVESFMRYYGLDENGAQGAVELYRVYYRAKGIYEAPLYEGVRESLTALKEAGKALYVATSKPEVFARQIIKHSGLEGLFNDIVGSNLDGTRVDKSEVISLLLEKNQITDKSRVLMIGDRQHDIIGAKAVGVSSVGVLYGYGNYEELSRAGADRIIEKIEDLLNVI